MAPGLSDPNASRALLIGTARYERLPQLPAVDATSRPTLSRLADLLSDDIRWGWPGSRGCRPRTCTSGSTAILDRRARRLLRHRPGRRQTADRLDDLEHGPTVVERPGATRAGGHRGGPADV